MMTFSTMRGGGDAADMAALFFALTATLIFTRQFLLIMNTFYRALERYALGWHLIGEGYFIELAGDLMMMMHFRILMTIDTRLKSAITLQRAMSSRRRHELMFFLSKRATLFPPSLSLHPLLSLGAAFFFLHAAASQCRLQRVSPISRRDVTSKICDASHTFIASIYCVAAFAICWAPPMQVSSILSRHGCASRPHF